MAQCRADGSAIVCLWNTFRGFGGTVGGGWLNGERRALQQSVGHFQGLREALWEDGWHCGTLEVEGTMRAKGSAVGWWGNAGGSWVAH